MGRRVALLIATYEYADAGLRRLTAPAHDAEALSAVLGDPQIAGFEVTTLVNEPHYRVGEAIGDFYRDRRRDDLTLLYFTGHGLKDDEGRLHLAMADTRRDSLMFTALSAEQIDRAMEGCACRQKVLILDCCYSGAYPAGRLAKADDQVHTLERFQGRGRTVLTASDATQYSFEGDQSTGEAPRSVFTRHLVAGLRDGSADLDGDGDITIDELYSYVHDRVIEDTPQQRPKKQEDVQGRTVIARNIGWDLPGYVRHAIASPIATDRLGALDALARLHSVGNETVRVRILAEMCRLADDDSRTVSAAAAQRLAALTAERPSDARSGVSPPATDATSSTHTEAPDVAINSSTRADAPDPVPASQGTSPVATVDDCRQALHDLAARLDANVEARGKLDLDRTLACRVPDLETAFHGRLIGGRLVDITDGDDPNAKIALIANSADLLALVSGRIDLTRAVASRQVAIAANPFDLFKLRKVL